jgi:hypothetical protein
MENNDLKKYEQFNKNVRKQKKENELDSEILIQNDGIYEKVTKTFVTQDGRQLLQD